jgi:hypothetical protein
MKFVKDQEINTKKAQNPYKPRASSSSAKEGSSEVITDATPVTVVPGRIPI